MAIVVKSSIEMFELWNELSLFLQKKMTFLKYIYLFILIGG